MTTANMIPSAAGSSVGFSAGAEQSFSQEVLQAIAHLWNGHDAVQPIETHPLGPAVWRMRVAHRDGIGSMVVKRLDPAMARRNRLVAERWLPAVDLRESGPPLLLTIAEQSGNATWQVYEDLGDWALDESARARDRVSLAVELIALVHTRFAEHPLLAECRLWGTDFGIHWYSSNLRDATRALKALRTPQLALTAEEAEVRDRLLKQMAVLRACEPWFAGILAHAGGPETLLHGDLWPKNALVYPRSNGWCTRLIDWDRAGVGPVVYDLSTLLSRFPPSEREWIVACYRESVRHPGLTIPGWAELDVLFAMSEAARLTNRMIWPALAAAESQASRAWAFAELADLGNWLEHLRVEERG